MQTDFRPLLILCFFHVWWNHSIQSQFILGAQAADFCVGLKNGWVQKTPYTLESQKNLKDEGEIHVFNDEFTLNYVTELIFQQGYFSGWIRGHQRFGLMFIEQIGYRLDQDGNILPLHYAEMKINRRKVYHVIPRTKPST